MKKQIILLVIVLLAIPIFAQEDVADYKKFEMLTKKINDIQRTADGKIFKNGDTDIQISMPSMNFIFNYGSLSASWIFGNGNQLAVFENFNLADVNSILLSDEQFGDTGLIAINFPQKQKATLVDGEKVAQQDQGGIPFYFSAKETTNGNEMFDALTELIYLCKVKKGKLTEHQAQQQQQKWKETRQVNTAKAYYDFLTSYPNTIFTQHTYNKAESLDPYIKYFTKDYTGFYLGISETDFKDLLKKRIKEEASKISKIDKNLKLFIDNYEIELKKNESYSFYYLENTCISVLYDWAYLNAGQLVNICAENDYKIDCFKANDYYATYNNFVYKLGINYKKKGKLVNTILPDFFYRIANVQNSDLQNTFVNAATKSMPTEFIFKNGHLNQISYSFVIHNNYSDPNELLKPIYNALGTPQLEKKYIAKRDSPGISVDGKVAYFDKGKYYIVAKAIRTYSSAPFAVLSPYFVSLTIKVK